MNDDELLTKYKSYIKKRNMVIIASLLFIIFIGLVFLSSIYKKTPESSADNPEQKQEEIIKPIDEAPILKLNTESITIYIGDSIDYEKYISEATDDIDGNLTSKVQFSKIDTSKVGEYEILYFVFDSSNNVSKEILKVIIKELPKQEEPPEDKKEPENNEESKPNKTTQSTENNNTPTKPITKYFLFTDGYTMNNVVEACAKELKEYGGSGRCEPITDENGIYLGMKLELKQGG